MLRSAGLLLIISLMGPDTDTPFGSGLSTLLIMLLKENYARCGSVLSTTLIELQMEDIIALQAAIY